VRIALVCTPHTDATLRLAAQVGVTDVVARYPPHLGRRLDEMVAQARGHGLALSIVEGYIPHDDLTHGRAGRERQLAGFVDLIREMAALGVGILCWNFMPDDDWSRTTTTAVDRGGALVTAFDAAALDPAPGRGGPITADRLWDNLAWFLDRVVPVAEREGVRLALHPDDPPMSPLRHQERILVSPEAFERVFAINDSPMNGMCFCQGTFASMGNHDIPALIRRFGPRIHYVHFRDVAGAVPAFRETFHDNGKTDMAEAIRAYRAIGFTGPARPDHVPTLEGESNELAGYHMQGRLFAVGYMRGLLDATG
jgi:mannonate dehydratase